MKMNCKSMQNSFLLFISFSIFSNKIINIIKNKIKKTLYNTLYIIYHTY